MDKEKRTVEERLKDMENDIKVIQAALQDMGLKADWETLRQSVKR